MLTNDQINFFLNNLEKISYKSNNSPDVYLLGDDLLIEGIKELQSPDVDPILDPSKLGMRVGLIMMMGLNTEKGQRLFNDFINRSKEQLQ